MLMNSSPVHHPDPRQHWGDDDYVLVHADTAAPESRSLFLPAGGEPTSTTYLETPPPGITLTKTLGTAAATVAEVTAQKIVPALWYMACGGIALMKESLSEILCVVEHAAHSPGPPFFNYG